MLFWKELQHFDQSRTNWPPLDIMLPQDTTAAMLLNRVHSALSNQNSRTFQGRFMIFQGLKITEVGTAIFYSFPHYKNTCNSLRKVTCSTETARGIISRFEGDLRQNYEIKSWYIFPCKQFWAMYRNSRTFQHCTNTVKCPEINGSDLVLARSTLSKLLLVLSLTNWKQWATR